MARRELPRSNASLTHNGHHAVVMHRRDWPGSWQVFLGDEYIGALYETEPVPGEPWTHYRARLPGDDDVMGDDFADDWREEVMFLIDAQF